MTKLAEFFQDDKGALSMTRLTTFGAFVVSSYVVVHLVHDKLLTDTIFSAFLGIFTLGYGISRAADSFNSNAEAKNALASKQP